MSNVWLVGCVDGRLAGGLAGGLVMMCGGACKAVALGLFWSLGGGWETKMARRKTTEQ